LTSGARKRASRGTNRRLLLHATSTEQRGVGSVKEEGTQRNRASSENLKRALRELGLDTLPNTKKPKMRKALRFLTPIGNASLGPPQRIEKRRVRPLAEGKLRTGSVGSNQESLAEVGAKKKLRNRVPRPKKRRKLPLVTRSTIGQRLQPAKIKAIIGVQEGVHQRMQNGCFTMRAMRGRHALIRIADEGPGARQMLESSTEKREFAQLKTMEKSRAKGD